jgi:hypothetical protein
MGMLLVTAFHGAVKGGYIFCQVRGDSPLRNIGGFAPIE